MLPGLDSQALYRNTRLGKIKTIALTHISCRGAEQRRQGGSVAAVVLVGPGPERRMALYGYVAMPMPMPMGLVVGKDMAAAMATTACERVCAHMRGERGPVCRM